MSAMTTALYTLTLVLLSSTAVATRNHAGSRSCSSSTCAGAQPEFGVLGADAADKCASGATPDWLLPGSGSVAAPRQIQESGAPHRGLCTYYIENNGKLAGRSEASTVDIAVGSAADFVGRLGGFAAFAPEYKPDRNTDKSRTSTCPRICCIGGGAAATCEVTEEAATRKVNAVFSSESSVLINHPSSLPDDVSWPVRFTGGFS